MARKSAAGEDSGVVGDGALDRCFQPRAPAFLHFEDDGVAHFRAKNFRQLGRDEQTIRRKFHRVLLVVEQTVEIGIARQARDAEAARTMAEA